MAERLTLTQNVVGSNPATPAKNQSDIPIASISQVLSKPVAMMDKNNIILEVFDSAIEAGRYIHNQKISSAKSEGIKSHIVQVCNNKRQSAYGFNWKYL